MNAIFMHSENTIMRNSNKLLVSVSIIIASVLSILEYIYSVYMLVSVVFFSCVLICVAHSHFMLFAG